jgi:rSAM/selenodomain-associated transferase 1
MVEMGEAAEVRSGGLLLFARFPEKGKVKSRLAATIGEERALRVYSALFDHTREVCAQSGIPTALCLAERPAVPLSESVRIQSEGSLGERMANEFRISLYSGSTPVILLGSDCPDVNEAMLLRAFELLQTHDVVIGPVIDGGYFLIGMNAYHPEVFEQISWSTLQVLEQTIERCRQNHLSFATLPRVRDIDVEDDLLACGHAFLSEL